MMRICTTVGIEVIETQSIPVCKPTTKPLITTSTYRTAYATIKPVKDDASVTPTLKTLCTVDTRSSEPTHNNDTDVILNIMIWNQPIIQYQMPIQPFVSPRNRSRRYPSTAIQYALIGVYDKLLNPSKLRCILSFSLLVSYMLHYPVLFCLPIHLPWLKLMIDTLMNGMINR